MLLAVPDNTASAQSSGPCQPRALNASVVVRSAAGLSVHVVDQSLPLSQASEAGYQLVSLGGLFVNSSRYLV